MPASAEDIRIIAAAYEERIKDLFKTFAEGVAIGEPEREAVVRFRRGILLAQRVRELALDAAAPDQK